MGELYEEDFYSWTKEQARFLKEKNLNKMDIDNLIEEIESLGKRDLRALESQIERLLKHLLKWKFQPKRKSKSWKKSILESRFSAVRLMEDSPSLESKLKENYTKCFQRSVKSCVVETGLEKSIFPKENPWTLEEILDEDFWPI